MINPELHHLIIYSEDGMKSTEKVWLLDIILTEMDLQGWVEVE